MNKGKKKKKETIKKKKKIMKCKERIHSGKKRINGGVKIGRKESQEERNYERKNKQKIK